MTEKDLTKKELKMIAEAEKRKRARLLDVEKMEKRVHEFVYNKMGLNYGAIDGTRITYSFCAETDFSSDYIYRYNPEGTIVSLEVKRSKLKIVGVRRGLTENEIGVHFSEKAKENLIYHFSTWW